METFIFEKDCLTTCASRDNARVLRPVLRGTKGATPLSLLSHLKTTALFKGICSLKLRSAETKKMLLAMKLTAIILFIACLSASAKMDAQGITLSLKDASIEKVFQEIRKQSGMQVLYTKSMIKDASKVSVNVRNVTLETALQDILKNQKLSFTIVNNTIVIKEKENSPKEDANLRNEPPPIDVTGKVTDADGNPLAGATVKVKGSDRGTTTNNDGVFTLKGIDENATLEISYVGYQALTVAVNNSTSLVAALKLDEKSMGEVIINKGYYTEKQRLSTANVTKITASEIERQPVNNPILALAGKVPGLFIEQTTGVPGGGVKVRIQGQNSLSRGSEPLYVIDGVPYTQQLMENLSGPFGVLGASGGSPLSFINPADIEAIEVLKDADATSIYGSRAAAGAILITTKKGKSGKTKVDINTQTGFGKVTRFLPLLNTEQYIEMRREAFANDNIPLPDFTIDPIDINYDINGFWNPTRYTDWQKELLGGAARYNDIQASVSGGNANTTFLIGSGYHKETTVFPGDLSDQKGSLHLNINNISTNQKFHTQFSGTYLGDNNNLINTDLTSQAVYLSPNAPPIYNSDGSLNWAQLPNGTSTWYNPLAYFTRRYNSKSKNLIANAIMGYQILKGLNLQSSFGYNNLHTDEYMLYPSISNAPETRVFNKGLSQFSNSNITSWIIEPQASYNTNVLKGKFDILFGATVSKENRDNQLLQANNYSTDLLLTDIKSAGSISVMRTSPSVYRYNAIFSRINYNYQNRYIINLTGRRDGSSRFGSENLFHNFYSIAGAWIFSNESFIQKKLGSLSYGKLRASYGTTGNDQIGDYQFLNLYNSINVAQPYDGVSVLSPGVLPNPFLQWEETKKLQFGVDLGFFNDRILLNAGYYLNRSSNQLQQYTLPYITGRSSIQRNFPATIQNYGWEITLNTSNIQTKNITWKTSFNFTAPKNKLVSFPELASSSQSAFLIVGQPFTITKAYHFLNVDPTNGLYVFEDQKGIPVSSILSDSALTRIVNTSSSFYGGFQNAIQFKRFELTFLLQFTKQVKRADYFGNRPGAFYSDANGFLGANNQPNWVLNRWQKPGDNAGIQKFSSIYPFDVDITNYYATQSDATFSDASFIRVRNASLSWQVPEKWKQLVHLQDVRVYVQGQNLWTITNYKGIDPETGSANLAPLRIITAGIKLSL